MLPKFIYESLPYLNLSIGTYLICQTPQFFTGLSGMLFFMAGALMWTMRSDCRRKDQNVRLRDYGDFNRAYYELKPFLLMLLGLLSARQWHFVLSDIIALILTMYGLLMLIKRALHRRYSLSDKRYFSAKSRPTDGGR